MLYCVMVKIMKIGNVDIKNRIIMAPMAGITNVAFRKIIKEFGAGLVVSEMVSDKALCYGNQKTIEMLTIDEDEHPVSIQIFGGDVDSMVQAAKFVDEHSNCDIIDINMGCPVQKVLKAHAGSYLLQYPDLVYDIVKNVLCQPIWQTIYDLWWSPAAFHLWFLRDLLVMIAFTPLLWIWAQKHWFSAFLIALISTYFYGWLVYFWAGIFLAVKKLDIETYPHSIWIIISCTFLYIGYAVYVSIYETLPSYIEVFINFAGIYMIWSIYDLFVQGRCMARKGIWKWICGYSFFVYCFHEPTFNIIKKVFGTIGRQNEFALIFFYIFNPWIMMAVAIVVAKLLQYVLPSVYKVLTGGR